MDTIRADRSALATQAITKTYGRGESAFSALRGITLDVQRGESLAIVGKSGSGKSTLMHLLALLDRPSTGSVFVNGEPVDDVPTRELNRLRNETFGFIFQQFFLVPGDTVLANVMLPLRIGGVPRRQRRVRALDALERVGLADRAQQRAVTLSGGQKQRVAIARALVGDPSVLFADEPTGNLDSANGETIATELFDLHRSEGLTLVLVTHDDDLAARCDRSITIADGLITAATTSNRHHKELASHLA